MSTPCPKIDILRQHMAAGDYRKAMALAASWPRLGDAEQAIRAAHEAFVRPDFQRQLKRDPAALVSVGIAALHRRYDQ